MKKRYRKGIGKSAGKGLGRPSVAKVVCHGIGNGISEEVVNGGEQNEERRIDMTTNNQCNHAEAIGKDFYAVVSEGNGEGWNLWNELTDQQRAAFVRLAEQALPIIGKHALEDVRDYLTGQATASKGWKKWLYWGGGVIIAGILGGGAFLTLGGCGHNVDVTPERTEVCKDGACLVLEPGHVSFSQVQPVTDVPPVVQGAGK